ncbi:MAG: hypothetical protein SFV19_01225 [Rhodospirillaceae bacterium]|nr:hypothetical protein [Rhodospirillaceae bacterium]
MKSDLHALLRRIKPQRGTTSLARRPSAALAWARDVPSLGAPLMLDTTVYIDILKGKTPPDVDALLLHRTCEHSCVCIAELTHAFGRLDPADPRTKPALREIAGLIERDIPAHRVHVPSTETWMAAGMMAGLIARFTCAQRSQGHEHKILNDALVYLQAARLGCAVLTRNIADFDIINQVASRGNVIFYQTS